MQTTCTGIAAECGLKRLMMCFDMEISDGDGGPRDRQDKVHVDAVWHRYESYRSGAPQGAHYLLPPNDPFADWHVSDRYAHQSCFDRQRAQAHQGAAQAVRDLLSKARLEGLLT